MSFILDALRKAEDRRGSRGPVEMPSLPRTARVAADRWRIPVAPVIAAGVLIAIGAALFIFTGRTDIVPGVTSAGGQAPTAAVVETPVRQQSMTPGGRAADSPRPVVRSLQREATATSTASKPAAPSVRDAGARPFDGARPRTTGKGGTVTYAEDTLDTSPQAPKPAARVRDSATQQGLPSALALASYSDLALATAGLPQLHIDLHVYSDDPQKRFVFVNMRKYRDGDRVNDDLTVDTITPDGAILVHRGRRFLLPRT